MAPATSLSLPTLPASTAPRILLGPATRTPTASEYSTLSRLKLCPPLNHPCGVQPSGHIVSIERMTPDLLGTSEVNVTGFFPDDFVESPSLFKRKGWYYLTYGSCCCGCSEGGGQAVFKARAIEGPWERQSVLNFDWDLGKFGGYSAVFWHI